MINLENDFMSVKIKKDGAELVSVYDKNREKEKMWSGDPKYWGRVSPVLFPFIGKLKDDCYIYENEKYEMTKHGFLRDQTFELVSQNDTRAVLSFQSNEETYKQYPFKHEVVITYTLKMRSVIVEWEVINLDDKEMFYSIGAHPAFKLDAGFDYIFTFPNQRRAHQMLLSETGLVSGKEVQDLDNLAISKDKFINDAIIYEDVDAVVLQKKDSSESVRMNFKGFPYVGLWSPIVDDKMAPFVCIEPWVGIADEVNSKNHLDKKLSVSKLSAQDSKKYRYEMIFQ